MTRPTAENVADTVAALNALLRTTAGGFARRIALQIERDRRGGSAIPDGYPTSTLGGGGGGSEDTSTERAALTLAEHHIDDEHHRLTWAAWHKLEAMLIDAQLIHGWLARLEAAARPAQDDDAWCENHLRHGVTEPRDTDRRLVHCAWCYGISREYGTLPNRALIDLRSQGKRVTEQLITTALGVQRKAS